ncbi:MAG TPA: 1,4-dihydroxy-6-naphthoate synthase [Acidothermaceae bacterium]
MTAGRLSLAFSPCPNDTFAFYAWTHGLIPDAPPVDITFADVDVTNGAAERGELDVVKVSYAALPWLLDQYALLPSGGALGRGCGPLVLTAGRRDLRGASIVVPGERTTAYLLFRLWAANQGVGEISVLPFPQIMPAVRDGRFDAGLVIHEARFTYTDYGLTNVMDLGAWWEADTGLPIPLGAIIARRSLDTDVLARSARASVEHAFAHPSASASFVAAHASEMDPDVQARHIALYVNEFSVDLGDEGYAAIDALLKRAADAGLVPPVDPAGLR